MAASRPLTKEMLKKLFLKTLHEFRPGGKLEQVSSSFEMVVKCIPRVFPELEELQPDENHLGIRAVFELNAERYAAML